MSALDQMGLVVAMKPTQYGKKRSNFEDLTGQLMPNGWRFLKFEYAFSGASYWSFESSDGIQTGIAPSVSIKRRRQYKPPVVGTAIEAPLTRAEYLTDSDLGIPTPRKIIDATCSVYGLKYAQLSGASRNKTLVEARWVAMWMMRTVLKMSYPEIGKVLMRDHTTVIHAMRCFDKRRDESPIVHARLAAVAEKLK